MREDMMRLETHPWVSHRVQENLEGVLIRWGFIRNDLPPPPKMIQGRQRKACARLQGLQRNELLLLHVQEPAMGRVHATFYVTHKAYSVQ